MDRRWSRPEYGQEFGEVGEMVGEVERGEQPA